MLYWVERVNTDLTDVKSVSVMIYLYAGTGGDIYRDSSTSILAGFWVRTGQEVSRWVWLSVQAWKMTKIWKNQAFSPIYVVIFQNRKCYSSCRRKQFWWQRLIHSVNHLIVSYLECQTTKMASMTNVLPISQEYGFNKMYYGFNRWFWGIL